MSSIDLDKKNVLVEGRAVNAHEVSLHETAVERLPVKEWRDRIYDEGICAIKGAFSREWASKLREEYEPLKEEACATPHGTMNRGPNRFYHAIYPERLSGFLDVVTHPAFTGLCEAVLGPDYYIVEVGFDCPSPGAKDQPWHRDFEIGSETLVGRWLSSLAFNITTVDVTEDMGAFQIAPGTHWEDGADFEKGMFPPVETYSKYEQISRKAYPKLGDMSCRTGLAVHRGTEHNASVPRPVLIIGVIARLLAAENPHKVRMTKAFYEKLPKSVQERLLVHLTDEIEPIQQEHDIEGLRYQSAG